jgi:hypothetical protein
MVRPTSCDSRSVPSVLLDAVQLRRPGPVATLVACGDPACLRPARCRGSSSGGVEPPGASCRYLELRNRRPAARRVRSGRRPRKVGALKVTLPIFDPHPAAVGNRVNPATSKRPFAVRMDAVVAEHLFGGGHDRNADVDHL